MDNLSFEKSPELSEQIATRALEDSKPPTRHVALQGVGKPVKRKEPMAFALAIFRIAYRLGERRECSPNLPDEIKRLSDFHLASNTQIDAAAKDHIEALLRNPEVKHETKR